MQGVRIFRNEAYVWYVAMTKDEAQRRRWTFYEAVIIAYFFILPVHDKILLTDIVTSDSQ